MTALPHVDPGIHRTKHTVRIGTKSILMTNDETYSSITLYIGGHDLYCLDINILDPCSF